MQPFAVIVFATVAVAVIVSAERRFAGDRASRLFRAAWLFWFSGAALASLRGVHEVFVPASQLVGLGFGMLNLAGAVALSGARWPRPGFGVVAALGAASILAAIPLGAAVGASVAGLVESALLGLAAWLVWRSAPMLLASHRLLAGAFAAYAIQTALVAAIWAPSEDVGWRAAGFAFSLWAIVSLAVAGAQLQALNQRARPALPGTGIAKTGELA